MQRGIILHRPRRSHAGGGALYSSSGFGQGAGVRGRHQIQQRDPRVVHAADEVGGAVVGAVVDDDDLDPIGRVVLVQERANRLLDRSFLVAPRNDHTDQRRARKAPSDGVRLGLVSPFSPVCCDGIY